MRRSLSQPAEEPVIVRDRPPGLRQATGAKQGARLRCHNSSATTTGESPERKESGDSRRAGKHRKRGVWSRYKSLDTLEWTSPQNNLNDMDTPRVAS
ncbi:hypothetical protein NDU88_002117 [Pleurodeles waltl]|uniref:Uncharacterized protein n=1 Tax=Pleurodeles waltl TaxID=8319 RepID=A0AAV7V9N8_PLEWA|nr:hypothetical protein NDU88_002117 [Pleurodeles waltl]